MRKHSNEDETAAPQKLSSDQLQWIDQVCLDFDSSWRSGHPGKIEVVLGEATGETRRRLLYELLRVEIEYRVRKDSALSRDEYRRRFISDQSIVDEAFAIAMATNETIGTNAIDHAQLGIDVAGKKGNTTAETRPRTFGTYELIEVLGEGGMGIVYRARQHSSGQPVRDVALKVIRSDRFSTGSKVKDLILRFQQESRNAARLEHENIVPVYDVGECEGQPYFSMRYIDGLALDEQLQAGPLDGNAAASLMLPVARAVAYAHAEGVLHRDIKPRNVLVSTEGRPFVTDFGLSSSLDNQNQLTQTGELLGTPSYMSPEQAQGNSVLGPSADIYSLGATLYELITSRPPFRAASVAETLRQVIDDEPVPPRRLNPSIDRDLETICLKCLEKQPVQRYTSAHELADELERYENGQPISARPVSFAARSIRWCGRNRALSVAISSAMILLLILAIGGPLVAVDQVRLRARADTNARAANQERTRAEAGEAAAKKQRARAEAEEVAANRQRTRAEVGEAAAKKQLLSTRQTLYVAHVHLLQKYMNSNHLARIEDLLQRQIPKSGEQDLRSFEWYYWRRQYNQHDWEINTKGYLSRVDIAPNGEFILTTTLPRVARQPGYQLQVWDLPSCKIRGSIDGVEGKYHISTDSERLFVASYRGEVNCYDLRSFGKTTLITGTPRGRLWSSIHFSPDSKSLAASGVDGSICLVNLEDKSKTVVTGPIKLLPVVVKGTPVLNQRMRMKDPSRLQFSPSGRLLVWVDANSFINVWDTSAKKQLNRFKRISTLKGTQSTLGKIENGYTGPLVLSPDERTLYYSTTFGKIRKRKLGTDNDEPLDFTMLNEMVRDNSRIVGQVQATQKSDVDLDDAGTIFWDTATGEAVAETNDSVTIVKSSQQSVARLVVALNGDRLEIWDPLNANKLTFIGTHGNESTQSVHHVSGSADGSWLAWVNDDRSISIWNMKTRKQWKKYPGHNSKIRSLEFSPDSRWLVSGDESGVVKAWSIDDSNDANPHTSSIAAHEYARFSSDGDILMTTTVGSAAQPVDGDSRPLPVIRLWNTRNGRLLATPNIPSNSRVSSSTNTFFSRSGNRIALALPNVKYCKEIRIYDMTNGEHTKLDAPKGGVLGLDLVNDGQTVVALCNQAIYRWSLSDSESLEPSVTQFAWKPGAATEKALHRQPLCAFSADEKRVGIIHWAKSLLGQSADLHVLDLQSGKVTLHHQFNLGRYRSTLQSPKSIAFGSDARNLFTIAADADGTNLVQWDVESGERRVLSKVNSSFAGLVAFSPDGRYFAAMSVSGGYLRDLDSDAPPIPLDCGLDTRSSFSRKLRQPVSFSGLAFSDDGRTLLAVEKSGVLKRWSVQETLASGFQCQCSRLAFSPDGEHLALRSGNRLGIVATRTEAFVSWLPVSPDGSITYSPDGRLLACSSNNTILVCDPTSGKQLASFNDAGAMKPDRKPQPELQSLQDVQRYALQKRQAALEAGKRRVSKVALSADGKLLAAGFGSGELKLWEIQSQKEIAVLSGAAGRFLFHPNKNTLLVANKDHSLSIYDLVTLKEQQRLPDLARLVGLHAVSPDRHVIAVATSENILLWNVARLEVLATLRGHRSQRESRLISLSFSPDGRTLASTGADGTVKLWDTATFEEKVTWEDLKWATFCPNQNLDLMAGIGMDNRLRLYRGSERDKK